MKNKKNIGIYTNMLTLAISDRDVLCEMFFFLKLYVSYNFYIVGITLL